MDTIKRILEIDLPHSRSAFLWGARMAGKTTYYVDQAPENSKGEKPIYWEAVPGVLQCISIKNLYVIK